MKTRIGCLILGLFSLALSMAGQVGGGGTPSNIPRWTSSTTLGDSIIFQTGGGTVGTGLQATGGDGLTAQFGRNSFPGGSIKLTGGHGGGGARDGSTNAAPGGSVLITGGTGGSVFTCCTQKPGAGGSITLQPGAGGTQFLAHGYPGNVIIAPKVGRVGIRTSIPTATLEVGAGGTTLADAWSIRSSRRFKTNIQPLEGALEKIEQLQGVSYQRKSDGKHEIGVVAEDVDRVVPEVVSRNPKTKEVQGVDYSRLAALLIEAVKSQQAEIQHMKAQIEQLKSNSSGQ